MSAVFSEDRSRRYRLGRGLPPEVCFVMLNPSKAGENDDDPTVRRCMGFAERWGFSGIIVVNLIPVIATDPGRLPAWAGIDHDNSRHIERDIAGHETVLAWGGVRSE